MGATNTSHLGGSEQTRKSFVHLFVYLYSFKKYVQYIRIEFIILFQFAPNELIDAQPPHASSIRQVCVHNQRTRTSLGNNNQKD